MSDLNLLGIHHLTAVSASIRENLRFYTQALGMRLVKRSVNQDDVSAYHLFYADAVGTPGTDLTFFDWNLPRERRGTHRQHHAPEHHEQVHFHLLRQHDDAHVQDHRHRCAAGQSGENGITRFEIHVYLPPL